MAATFKERLVAGLKAYGWTEDFSDRSHYTAFVHPKYSQKRFVGTNGALRQGHCASKSISIGDATRKRAIYTMLLAAGDAALPDSDVNKHNKAMLEAALLKDLEAL